MTNEERSSASHEATSALVGAVVTVAFAVIALAGLRPIAMSAVASFAAGAGLIGHGVLTVRRLQRRDAPSAETHVEANTGEAAGDEILGGVAAIVCGILAMIGFTPLLLLGVSATAVGGALVLVAPAARHHELGIAAALVVGGVAAGVLGVLAVVGVSHALTLVEVAFVVIGAGLTASAAPRGRAIARREQHAHPA